MMKNVKKTKVGGKTDWNKIKKLTDNQVKKAALKDPDAALVSAEELIQFKPVLPPKTINVKRIRQDLNLTQKEFADCFGVSKRTVQEWEQGRRHPTATARNFLKVIALEPTLIRKILLSPKKQHYG